MPVAALRPCPTPGCSSLTSGGKCARCEGARAKGWGVAGTKRIRGRKLQRMRRRLFEQEPFCRMCKAKGEMSIATVRDHIIPLAEGGKDNETNEQPLCQTCSDVKTHEESMRGVMRRSG